MDTKKLHFFITLSETGNMREAAKLLNISHAGLSKAVHTLEVELGTTLITKDGRGIKITPRGLGLIKKMKMCLDAEDNLMKEVFDVTQSTKVNIGTFEVFSTYLATSLVKKLDSESLISFKELTPGALEREIIMGSVDYGISYVSIPKPNLDHFEITKIDMGVYGNFKSFKQLEFSELPFVIPISEVEGAPNRIKGLDGWPDDKIPRNIKYQVSLMETALELVRSGKAVGYFPRFVIELHNKTVKSEYQLKEFSSPWKSAKKQPVYGIKRKDSIEDAQFKRICSVLRSL